MKKNLLIWLTVFGFGILNSFSQTAVPGCIDGKIYLKYKPTAIVKYKDPTNISLKDMPGLAELIGKYGINSAEKPYHQATDSRDLMRIYKVGFTNITQVEDLIRDLSSNSLVEYAEKVPEMKLFYTPNDPSLATQWHLAKINATNAWNVFNGTSTIVVAVVDNAMAVNHPDLTANIWVNPGEIAGNFIDDDGNGYVDDVKGYDVGDNDNSVLPLNTTWDHGTHCCGIVGARTDNAIGISAIGFNVKIMTVKAEANVSGPTSISNGYGGIVYAARSGARVISCSWGGTVSAVSDQSVINYAWGKGCAIICAAANDGNSVLHYPAAYNNVYSVASSGTGDLKSGFSCYGTWVDITAPGENIYSTVPFSGYNNMSGTSMATPLVAGLAGLMLSKNPYLTATQVEGCISSSAANIYTVGSNSAYSPNQLGAGRIDAYQAMICASVTAGSVPTVDFSSDKQNTCPGNPIKFFDQSTLYPTTWSWTFQSGTPATSSVKNPTVSWAAAGTYSVGLTATNINGSGSITKIAYITITNPGVLPLVEGFQGAAWPPANWVDDNKFQDSVKYSRATSCGGYGLSSASLIFDNYYNDAAGVRDGFQMPKLNMSTISQATVNFDIAFARYDAQYSDTLEVQLSTNCGLTWNSIYMKGGTALSTAPDYTAALFVPTATQWRTESIVITGLAAGQSNVLMSFVNHGHYGNGMYIDNVNISYSLTGSAPVANYNYPASVCSGAAMTFTDASTNAPSSWSWNMPGASVSTSTLQNPTVTYATGGVYSVTLTATNGIGSNSTAKTFTIISTPTVAVNSATICVGNSANLIASGATTYSWNTSATTSSISVSPAVTTTYVVTGTTGGCPNVKTSVVNVNALPSLTLASSSATACTASSGGVALTLTGSPAGGVFSGPGVVGSTFTTQATSGTYTATYSYTNAATGCSNTTNTSILVSVCTGINVMNLLDGQLLVYPNPNNGVFNVQANFEDAFDVTIYNNIGQIIKQSKGLKGNNEIALKGYAIGIYNIVVNINGNYKTIKLVIE